MKGGLLPRYLDECHQLVLEQLNGIIPRNRYWPILYGPMLEYPLRLGKGFRPSLCIATCRALGGRLEDVLPTAAILEMYHNAFLLHDDVEDGSLMRRGQPTLHRLYGVPIAVNVGDGMHALCLEPLLDNARLLGLGKALSILRIVARMARESVEGQAIELDWVRRGVWDLGDRDYFVMTYKKTCWYTFIAPMQIGAIIRGTDPAQRVLIRKFATHLGIAFQIQDDLLNLLAEEGRYGKEIGGDLWEGKRTLVLLNMMRMARPRDRSAASRIFDRPRMERTEREVEFLYGLIHQYRSVDYARGVADRLARRAEQTLGRFSWMPPSVHRSFIAAMTEHVITRDK
jgi:geranylgeranyl diphosphate synthase, type II